MDNKIMSTILTVTIAIICVATILVPTLSDATKTEETFTNEGYYRMTHYDTTTSHTISWDYTDPNVITVDGEDITVGYTVKNSSCTVAIDTSWILRYFTDANGNGRAFGIYTFSSAPFVSANTGEQTNASVTLSEGTMSATFGNVSRTGTYTELYLPDPEGNYIMKDAGVPAYINGDSDFIAYGITKVNTASSTYDSGLSFVGNYEDDVTATVWRGTDNITLSETAVNVTEDDRCKDLYKLQSITSVATYTETVDDETVTTDTDVTYTYILVPYEVTAELSQHLTDEQNSLIMVIPVLMICAILVAAIGMLYLRNRD